MSYHLFRVGKVWHYRFQVDGRRMRRSTRETSYQLATAVADQAHREALLWSTNGAAVPTLRELCSKWLDANTPVMSTAHILNVARFGRLYLYGLADLPIDQLTTAQVEAARNAHLQGHAASTTNLWLRQLKLLCCWAISRDIIPKLPFRIKLIKVQQKPKTVLPSAMAAEWIAAVDAYEKRSAGVATAVRLMIGIGLRESETITARWEHVDWARQTYTPAKTKGREAVPLPMPGWLLDWLRPLRWATGLMIVKANGRAYTTGFTRRAMLHANGQCGAGHITAHRLRGTYATRLSETSSPIQSIQRAMRHKSALTTMAYLEPDLLFIARSQQRMAEEFGFNSDSIVSDKLAATHAPQSHAQQ